MRSIKTTPGFERDIKKAAKRGKDLDKLWGAVDHLSRGEPLSARHRRIGFPGRLGPLLRMSH